jgi:tripartite-type tricarboxylate transporter receptor subunit TctC
MAAVLMAEALNKAQSEDVFRVIVVNGNGGDAADSYAIERAKAGEDVLLWHSITSYTVNHKEGLLPLAGMRKVSFSIMVNPDSNINSVSDIVTKGKLFVAVSSGNAFGLLLLSSFEKKYHLDITRLSYKSVNW